MWCEIAAAVQPWVQGFVGLSLLVLLPIPPLLLIFRRTLGYGLLGNYFMFLRLGCALGEQFCLRCDPFHCLDGGCSAFCGVPAVGRLAAFMSLISAEIREVLGRYCCTAAAVLVLRFVGLWIVQKTEEWNFTASIRADEVRVRTCKTR